MKTKTCTKCGQDKPLVEFYADKQKGDGLTSRCKQCIAEYQKRYRVANSSKARSWSKGWKDRNPDKVKAQRKTYYPRLRDLRFRKKYNISLEDFESMKESQSGLCKICSQKRKLVVDHCHMTSRVRGLLCNSCNKALGFVDDNTSILQNMIQYLGDSS
jgi:hypothetical protein